MSLNAVWVSEMYTVFFTVLFISELTELSFIMRLDAAGLLHSLHVLQRHVTAGELRDTL